jgi:hypothetical protein
MSAQRKLREELLGVHTDNPSMNELNALPYLDSVIKDGMRVHAPIRFVYRLAMHDDVLPLSKPYTDIKGNIHDTISCVVCSAF